MAKETRIYTGDQLIGGRDSRHTKGVKEGKANMKGIMIDETNGNKITIFTSKKEAKDYMRQCNIQSGVNMFSPFYKSFLFPKKRAKQSWVKKVYGRCRLCGERDVELMVQIKGFGYCQECLDYVINNATKNGADIYKSLKFYARLRHRETEGE